MKRSIEVRDNRFRISQFPVLIINYIKIVRAKRLLVIPNCHYKYFIKVKCHYCHMSVVAEWFATLFTTISYTPQCTLCVSQGITVTHTTYTNVIHVQKNF